MKKLSKLKQALLAGLALNTVTMGSTGAENIYSHHSHISKKQQQQKDAGIEAMAKIVIKKMNDIFDMYKINPKSEFEQIHDAFILFKYIVNHANYDAKIMYEKRYEPGNTMRDHEIQDAYRCLIQGRSICTSDAIALNLLYQKLGLDSFHATICEEAKNANGELEETNYHEIVMLFTTHGEYICDPTTMRYVYEQKIIPNLEQELCLMDIDLFRTLNPNIKLKYIHDSIDLEQDLTPFLGKRVDQRLKNKFNSNNHQYDVQKPMTINQPESNCDRMENFEIDDFDSMDVNDNITKIIYFIANDHQLNINGSLFTLDEACAQYPKYAKEFNDLIKNSQRDTDTTMIDEYSLIK